MTSGLDANRAGVQAVDLADSWHADAFGRLRVSDIYSVFDSKLIYDLQPSWWEDTVSGAGAAVTYNAARSSATLTTGATTAANKAERQTRRYFQYVPGKSLVVFLTGVIGNGVTNCRKRWGYFDSNNGVFFQQDGDTISVVRRSDVGSVGTPTEDEVEQAAWNIDPLDGTGPSGIELDLTQANIFVIDLQWLGVGRVRMGVDIDGEIVPCHEFLNANALPSVYMRAADLPVRYSITNTGTATGTGSMEVICTSVAQEGGYGQRANEYPFSANTGVTPVTVTTQRAMLSIRPKSTFASKVNRIHIVPQAFSLFADASIRWSLIYNPTFTTGGGALTWTSADTISGVEYSIHGDANAGAFTGGVLVSSGYLAVSGSGVTAKDSLERLVADTFPIVLDQAGANPRALTLAATRVTAGATTVLASMDWSEYR